MDAHASPPYATRSPRRPHRRPRRSRARTHPDRRHAQALGRPRRADDFPGRRGASEAAVSSPSSPHASQTSPRLSGSKADQHGSHGRGRCCLPPPILDRVVVGNSMPHRCLSRSMNWACVSPASCRSCRARRPTSASSFAAIGPVLLIGPQCHNFPLAQMRNLAVPCRSADNSPTDQ